MKVKFFNAKNGDAIHLVTDADKHIILDMGYHETYTNYLKLHIKEIANNNGKVDLLVISHIDQDHISGAISFLEDICKNEFDKEIIGEIWHNSYRHLGISQIDDISYEDYRVLKIAKENFEADNKKKLALVNDKEISAKQGSTLAGLIYRLGISWNHSFDGKAILGISDCTRNNLNITILTPKERVFKKLKRFWKSELLKRKSDFRFGVDELFDDAYEFYLLNEAVLGNGLNTNISRETVKKFSNLLELGIYKEGTEDMSVTNASSISLIIEENGKRILLTADATDKDLFDTLNYLSNKGISLDFDVIKLSHHGAVKNNIKWLSLVTSDYYVISTDSSKHNHPDIEAIVNIINSNRTNHKTICFNNYLKIIEEVNDPALMEIYNYSILMPNQDWGVEIEL